MNRIENDMLRDDINFLKDTIASLESDLSELRKKYCDETACLKDRIIKLEFELERQRIECL